MFRERSGSIFAFGGSVGEACWWSWRGRSRPRGRVDDPSHHHELNSHGRAQSSEGGWVEGEAGSRSRK